MAKVRMLLGLMAALVMFGGNAAADRDRVPRCNAKIPGSWAGQTTTWHVKVGGQFRSFNVYLPTASKKHRPSKKNRWSKKRRPSAVVFAYDGWGGSAASMEAVTQLNGTADANNFAVVYPEPMAAPFSFPGPGGNLVMQDITSWNDHLGGSGSPGPAGPLCSTPDEIGSFGLAKSCESDPNRDLCNWADCATNDVLYASRIVEEVEERLCVDRERVYALGVSNGATMAQRMVCQQPDKFAGLVMVTGRPSKAHDGDDDPGNDDPLNGFNCTAIGEQVSLLQINGTNDPVVPIDGSPDLVGGFFPYISDDQMDAAWAGVSSQSCGAETSDYSTGFEGEDPTEAPVVECTRRDACETGAAVVKCRVVGMRHGWPIYRPADPNDPGSEGQYVPGRRAIASDDRFMNPIIWEFFDKNPKN